MPKKTIEGFVQTQEEETDMGTDLPLAGQVAVVAGATRGAGRGIAIALGEAGAFVCWDEAEG